MSLRKELSTADLIMMGLGNIVGAGIFVIISKLIFYGGNTVLLSIFIISFVSLVMGYIYLFLYDKYNSELVEYYAIRDNFGEYAGTASQFLIYFFAVASCVVISVSLTKYITHAGYYTNTTKWDKIITTGLILIMSYINYCGITVSKNVINTIGASMLALLGGIIILGIIDMKRGIKNGIKNDNKSGINGFIIATILSIFLFNGYDIIVKMSAETKDNDNVGFATMASIGITAVIYIFILIVVMRVLGIKLAGSTHHPLSLIYEKLMNKNAAQLSYIIGGFIMFNTAFISLLGGTRFFYGNIKNNNSFNHLNSYGSPDICILLTGILAIILSLIQNEVILAIITNFTVILILILLNLSYLKIKWNEDENNINKFIYEGIPFIIVLVLLIYLFVQIIYLKYKGAF